MLKQLCMMVSEAALIGLVIGAGLPAAPAHASGVLLSPMLPSTALRHVVIHNLFMDHNWDAHNPTMTRATLDDFTRKLVIGGYFAKAAQYGVVNAAFTGSDQATAACPVPGRGLDYNALSSWVLCEKHSLPPYGADGIGVTIWQVYVPVSSRIRASINRPWSHTWQTAPACETLSGDRWRGFHALTLPSVVPPDSPQVFGAVFLGCYGGDLSITTWTASQVLINAATDPDGFAWGNGALGGQEAADLCAFAPTLGTIDGYQYLIAGYQSNADGRCKVPGNAATFKTVPVVGVIPGRAASSLRAAGFLVSTTYVREPTCESIGLVIGEQPSAGSLVLTGSLVTLQVGQRPRGGCP